MSKGPIGKIPMPKIFEARMAAVLPLQGVISQYGYSLGPRIPGRRLA